MKCDADGFRAAAVDVEVRELVGGHFRPLGIGYVFDFLPIFQWVESILYAFTVCNIRGRNYARKGLFRVLALSNL
jgi:hypothetical protein